ncbi:hypothetical protein MKW94_012062, partial [Papaver nudicaule]|nr:hypothetical protein [Papaver nudicaule]
MTYVKAVKDKFLDNREKYDQFLQILKDFRAERTDTRGVIQRIEDLFKGHPDLILGFKAYLPKGYEISTTGEDEPSLKKPYEFEDLLTFLNKVQTQYQSDDHAFKSFLEVLSDSTVEGNSTTEIYDE